MHPSVAQRKLRSQRLIDLGVPSIPDRLAGRDSDPDPGAVNRDPLTEEEMAECDECIAAALRRLHQLYKDGTLTHKVEYGSREHSRATYGMRRFGLTGRHNGAPVIHSD